MKLSLSGKTLEDVNSSEGVNSSEDECSPLSVYTVEPDNGGVEPKADEETKIPLSG
jgi:hypothetical protein